VNQNKQGEDVASLVGATSPKQKRHIQSSGRLAGRISLTGKPARTCDGFGPLARSLPTISFMKAHDLAPRLKIIGGCALAIAAVWLCAQLALIVTSRALRKTDETVTLDPGRRSVPPSPPVISSAPLPAADGDLEVIGDRVAEAIIYLNHGRREAALRALDQAQTASRRALTSRPITDKVNEKLKLALREIEQARLQITRGKPGAALTLRKLSRQLDSAGI